MSKARTALGILIAAVSALTLLVLSSATPGFAQTDGQRRSRTLPFRVGETLTYDVSWSSFLTAGTVTLAVKDRRASSASTVYHIVGEARPTRLLSRLYSLYYRAETLVDAETLLPQRGSIYSEEGRRKRSKVTTFDRRAHQAEYEVQTATLVQQKLEVPAGVQDALCVLYAVRAMALKPGDRVTIPVSDSGKVYQVRLTIQSPEAVKTGLGVMDALPIVPEIVEGAEVPSDRRITLWVSTDGRRLPIKMQVDLLVGSFVLTLREAA